MKKKPTPTRAFLFIGRCQDALDIWQRQERGAVTPSFRGFAHRRVMAITRRIEFARRLIKNV